MQVLLVVIGIPISMALDLENQYGVAIVGNIPQGLPNLSVPEFGLFSMLIVDSFLIAFVGFGFTLSMAKLIAKRFNYSLNGNQELFAEVSVMINSNLHLIYNYRFQTEDLGNYCS